jgi:hypothetical protein
MREVLPAGHAGGNLSAGGQKKANGKVESGTLKRMLGLSFSTFNVQVFPVYAVELHRHLRNDGPSCTVIGRNEATAKAGTDCFGLPASAVASCPARRSVPLRRVKSQAPALR